MTVQIGSKIKVLRLGKSLTQEQLAQSLGVSPQAVSKWENNAAMPDIQLLPQLSVELGSTIDALFSMTDESRMERIDNMIWDRQFIAEADFKSEEEFLKSKCLEQENKPRATLLLAELYCKRAREYNAMAAPLARLALELSPENRDAHNAVFDAEGGAYLDWNAVNHNGTIDFYRKLIANHPKERRAYLWMLDLLVADCRCEEARAYLTKMNSLGRDFNSLLYLGMILNREGKREEAVCTWAKMTEEHPNLAEAWFARANECAKLCRYDEAITFFKKYAELAKHPKFIDVFESMAKIYEILGEYQNAIDCNKEIIRIMKEDWDETAGEAVEKPKREIERLCKKLEKQ